MLRRAFLGGCAGRAAGRGVATAALSGLHLESVADPESLEPTALALLHESQKQAGLLHLPPYNKRSFAFAAKTKSDEVAGGLYGFTNYNELHVAMLAVNPQTAVRGTGTTLLRAAEAAARTQYDCNRIALETFSWQARPFYERYGFALFGVQPGQPAGHEKYFMEKVWEAAAAQNSEPLACYAGASSELKVEAWDVKTAYAQLGRWLDEDTQKRKGGSVPPYDMTPYALRVTNAAGTVVACCMYETWWDELHVDKLVVAPEMQRKGIGSAVLRHVEEIAREKKLQQLVADAMSWQAYPFYEKHGFKVFATQKNVPVGYDHLRLLRVLQ